MAWGDEVVFLLGFGIGGGWLLTRLFKGLIYSGIVLYYLFRLMVHVMGNGRS
jgi:hypothetical protein